MVLFTHVLISLIALAAGFPLIQGLLRNQLSTGVSRFFLTTTLLTSATGFLFPFHGVQPGHVFAVLTFLLLGAAVKGGARTYVVGTLTSLYLNWIVLIVQLYQKTPALQGVAATQGAAQLALLVTFLAVGARALRSYRG
ncbi:MAG: hypothetical protein J0I12_35310 [Candidatus Eremiobacteraeota bacterium]|nr:hypothetical protein [Candidatus Eremiobacteraeota bacterium]